MYENKETGKDSTSMGSRTSSTTSLETMNNQHGGVVKTPTEPTSPVSKNMTRKLAEKIISPSEMLLVTVLAENRLLSIELYTVVFARYSMT